jgi:hypothetical protein
MVKLTLSKVSTRARIALSIVVVILFLLIGGFAWWLTRDATVNDDVTRVATGVANEPNTDEGQDANNVTKGALSQPAIATVAPGLGATVDPTESGGSSSTEESSDMGADGEPSQAEDVLSAVDVARLLTE